MEMEELGSRLQKGRFGATTKEILELGLAAASVKSLLGLEERKAWLQECSVHMDTFAKAVSIGENITLHQPQISELLPASFSVIAFLSRWTSDELFSALHSGSLCPSSSYRDLVKWQKDFKGEQMSRSSPFILQPIVIATDATTDHIGTIALTVAINKALGELGMVGQAFVLDAWENVEQQVSDQWAKWNLDVLCEEFNADYAVDALNVELLNQPLKDFKKELADLGPTAGEEAYAIWTGYQSHFGESKHQRYNAKKRLVEMEGKGISAAGKVLKRLFGSTQQRSPTVGEKLGEG